MRKTLIFLAATAMFLQCDQLGGAQGAVNPNRNNGIFWAPTTSRQVTIARQGRPFVVLTFPASVFLDVEFTEMQPMTNAGQWIFAGDVRLRAQPAASAPGQAPGRTAAEIMSGQIGAPA